MARIGLDARAVSPEGKGISRVQRRAVEALAALRLPHELVVFVAAPDAAELFAGLALEVVVAPHRLTLGWEQLGLPRAVRRCGLDLVLTTTDRLPLVGRGRYVVWLYEVPTHRIEQNRLHRAHAHQRASDLVTLALWKRSVRRAARVVTAARATAEELKAAVPGLGQVAVIPPGLDEGFSPGPDRADGRYALHLASSDPRDNTETILAAFARARPDLPLLVAGGLGARRGAIEAEIERLGLRGSVELLGRVSDEELVSLYRGAAAFLDASLFEGFGYQALEAMACGTPVIASSTTSIPEVVGDAGVLCDPRSSEQFAAALRRVLEDEGLAAELRRRGLERAAQFTWERTARAFAELFEELL